MKKSPKLDNVFTPNVQRGCGNGERYLLYVHDRFLTALAVSASRKPMEGSVFLINYEQDDCGLGCRCGAFITNISEQGKRLLSEAKRIDSQSEVIK